MDFWKKFNEKNKKAKEEEERRREEIKDVKRRLLEEMQRDESNMTNEERRIHVDKIRAFNDYLDRECKGMDNRNNADLIKSIGIKVIFTAACIGLEAFLLNSGRLTRMKEKLIDNIMRVH